MLAVDEPIGVLLILPANNAPLKPIPPVTTSVPVVVLVDAVFAVNFVAPFDVNDVNAPVLRVELPTAVPCKLPP